ncbi:MAG: hypothetical protein ABL884_00185 [Methyloglobulus sp.]
MNKLREFLKDNPRTSIVFAALIGVLFSVLHEGFQKLLLPVASYLQPFLLNSNSSFFSEVVVNCLFQGLIALVACLVIVPLFVKTLRPQSMRYPLVAVGADLIYSFWWLPFSIYLNTWPAPIEYMPVLYWSSCVTSAIFLGSLLWVVRKTH